MALSLVWCGCADAERSEPDAGALRRASDPWACSADAGCARGAEAEGSEAASKPDATPDTEPPTCPAPSGGADVTLAGLVAGLVDLDRLTRLPGPAFTSALSSSHDPLSDEAEVGSDDWFANRDFVELAADETAVLLDVQGPGVVTRIWAASPAGTLRIYVDDDAEPVVETPFEELARGFVEPFVEPFAFVAAGGHNLYFPIPFASSCRITLTGETPRSYYHVGYRSYESGTDVQSFGAAALDDSACVRGQVVERLRALTPTTAASDSGQWRAFSLSTAEPSSGVELEAAPGGSLLRQLRVRVADPQPGQLRATVLSIAFDGEETVRVPIGDFFASGLATDELNSVPIGVDAASGWLSARWPMPFEREARIAIEAAGDDETRAELELLVDEAAFDDRTLLFHAQWHAPETFASKPSSDWNLATLEGEGLYVGNVLNVINRADSWWGEGDEKIYVDDETFPSHFGTGTEDYYGYAFCSNERFTTAFVGQPLVGRRRNFGRISLYRFHVSDPIPFRQALRFDLGVRHWGDPVDVTYDAVSFWYARRGSRMQGAPAPNDRFSVPDIGVPAPDVAEGTYRCGG